MFRGVVQADPMWGLGQKRCPRRHRPEDALRALMAHVVGQAVGLGYETSKACRLMNIAIIGNKMPPRDRRIGGTGAHHMGDKVFLRACGPQRRRDHGALRYVEIGDQRDGAMADIFELTPLRLARCHEPRRMFALQRLDAGHFVCGQDTLTRRP